MKSKFLEGSHSNVYLLMNNFTIKCWITNLHCQLRLPLVIVTIEEADNISLIEFKHIIYKVISKFPCSDFG